jgi:hypothetical protein
MTCGTPVSSTNITDRHDITEILLEVALNTIPITPLPESEKLDIHVIVFVSELANKISEIRSKRK